MPLMPDGGQIILDEIGLATGRLGGWILRASFTPVFQRTGDALQPAAVLPGLLVSRDTGSSAASPIDPSQRRVMACLAAELHRIDAAHIGAPGLCIIEGCDGALRETGSRPCKRIAAFAPPDEVRRFGRVLAPVDPFAWQERPVAAASCGAPDIVRLDIRNRAGRAMSDLTSAYRAEGLDILLCGIADARLLERALEIGGLLAGSYLGAAQPAGTEIDMAPRPLAGLLKGSGTLVAFRPRRQKSIKAPDRRVQNL